MVYELIPVQKCPLNDHSPNASITKIIIDEMNRRGHPGKKTFLLYSLVKKYVLKKEHFG